MLQKTPRKKHKEQYNVDKVKKKKKKKKEAQTAKLTSRFWPKKLQSFGNAEDFNATVRALKTKCKFSKHD